MSKSILITGLTGKQGTAVLKHLSRSPEFTLLGLTRNANSATCASLLKSYPRLQFVTGNLDHPKEIFDSLPASIWGIFSVQAALVSGFNPSREEKQGMGLIDEAILRGVKHFVYSSVDRHGDASDNNPTNVPHFQSKFRIEEHLKKRCQEEATTMTYSILRLPTFMDNLSDDFVGRFAATAWKVGLRPGRKLQVIATDDIGHYASEAFTKLDLWRNRAVSLSGDELTFAEANRAFAERFGHDIPRTFDFLGWIVLHVLWFNELAIMFKWWDQVGSLADVGVLRGENPELKSFKDWLEESDFAKK